MSEAERPVIGPAGRLVGVAPVSGRLLAELLMENELLGMRAFSRAPLDVAEIRAVSRIISPATGRRYGVERVCRVWRVPRSRIYRAGMKRGRRGRPPEVTDEELRRAVVGLLRTCSSRPSGRWVWCQIRKQLGRAVSRRRVGRLLEAVRQFSR